MTGFKSKRDMAEDKLLPQKDFGDALTIAYQSGYYDGKKAAQPAQEPVAWYHNDFGVVELSRIPRAGWKPLTTPLQRPWVGLTDEEIAEVEDEFIVDYRIPAGSAWDFARAIEAKLKEKNT